MIAGVSQRKEQMIDYERIDIRIPPNHTREAMVWMIS
jgi:hypothetical protein